MKSWLVQVREVSGAFADGAVLFPILFLLIFRCGFSAPALWCSTGLVYLAAGFYFKIPMPVQPLKSLALTAVALQATPKEVRLACAAVAGVCLFLSFFKVEKIIQLVPKSLVHGIQLGLGILLLGQGYQLGLQNGWGFLPFLGAAGLGVLALLLSDAIPILGLLAVVALLWGSYESWGVITTLETPLSSPLATHLSSDLPPHLAVLAALVLPQLPLTLANSVIGTCDVAQRYFGQRAVRVTPRALLLSIGLGNVLTACGGGIPFCHGAGGMTAHYRGGAQTDRASFYIGIFLLALGALSFFYPLRFQYPPFLWASLLTIIGIFHLKLAAPTWAAREGKVKLLVLAVVAALSFNMLWIVMVGVLLEFVSKALKKPPKVTDPWKVGDPGSAPC